MPGSFERPSMSELSMSLIRDLEVASIDPFIRAVAAAIGAATSMPETQIGMNATEISRIMPSSAPTMLALGPGSMPMARVRANSSSSTMRVPTGIRTRRMVQRMVFQKMAASAWNSSEAHHRGATRRSITVVIRRSMLVMRTNIRPRARNGAATNIEKMLASVATVPRYSPKSHSGEYDTPLSWVPRMFVYRIVWAITRANILTRVDMPKAMKMVSIIRVMNPSGAMLRPEPRSSMKAYWNRAIMISRNISPCEMFQIE